MSLKLDHKEIGSLLDSAARQLDRDTASELQRARLHALQHQRTASSFQADWKGVLTAHPHFSRRALNWGIAALFTALFLANMAILRDAVEHNHDDVDVAILTDDMPLYIYVDTDVD